MEETPPPQLTFYSTAPRPLDIAWCQWPLTEGGFKSRPVLINQVLEDDGRFAVEVCYGTSAVDRSVPGVGSFRIVQYEQLQAIGLYKATRFELLTRQLLPWAQEVFPRAPGRSGPIVGRMTQLQILRLQEWSRQTKHIIEALLAGEDGNGQRR